MKELVLDSVKVLIKRDVDGLGSVREGEKRRGEGEYQLLLECRSNARQKRKGGGGARGLFV